jgi:hypothetical protein
MNKKKLIAPIIITVLLVAYLVFYVYLCITTPISILLKIIGCLVLISLIGASVFVLVERIKEIRSGEEDDLGKY